MKIYLTTYFDEDSGSGPVQSWHGSKKEAAKKRRELEKEGFSDSDTEAVIVKPGKRGLLAFLNSYATSM